jgi:uncharacterized membrane protein YfcA
VIGFLVGGLVTLTGIGGGILLLPLLILGLRVRPIVAVGSDSAFMFLTKIGAAASHGRYKNVDWRLASRMALGSVPSALAGFSVLAYLRFRYGEGVNIFLRSAIGILLLLLPLILSVQSWLKARAAFSSKRTPLSGGGYRRAIYIGMLGGFLVGLTSVGSGSVIMALLLLFYSAPPRLLVGSDIVHATILTGVTALLHLKIGTIDPRLVGLLMVGAVPGVLLSSSLMRMVPLVWLRRVLLLLLITAGLAMAW